MLNEGKKILINMDNQKKIRHEDFVAGISKGMAILECFGPERQRLNVTMAAEKTGLTRAATRRHLLTLEYLGYLDFDGHYYYLTPKVLKFSGAYLSGSQLPKICQPLLNLLTTQTSLIFQSWYWMDLKQSLLHEVHHINKQIGSIRMVYT